MTPGRRDEDDDDHDDNRPITNREIWRKLNKLDRGHDRLSYILSGEDGKGGVAGDVSWLKTEMRGLIALKNSGVGLIAGIVLVLAIVVLGLKGAFAAAFSFLHG